MLDNVLFRAAYVFVIYAKVHYLESFKNWDLNTTSKQTERLGHPHIPRYVCVKRIWVLPDPSYYFHNINMTVCGMIMCLH